jgi:hypothetical protein
VRAELSSAQAFIAAQKVNQGDDGGPGQFHHRKLKGRLANNHEWLEFEGHYLASHWRPAPRMLMTMCLRWRAVLIAAWLRDHLTPSPAMLFFARIRYGELLAKS